MTIPFDGGLTCALRVTNLTRSIAWYRDVLGFQFLYEADGIGWCEFATPVGRVNVGLSQTETAGGPGGATLTFGVTDIVATKAHLTGHGVGFDGDIRLVPGLVRLLTAFDPDHNPLMFYEELKKG